MRITLEQLEKRVERLNELAGNPVEPSSEDGFNVGTYVIDANSGGFSLSKITNKGGGEKSVTPKVTKTQLYYLVNSYIDGYSQAIEDINQKNQ